MTLKLTPSRLSLLRAIERGEVRYWPAVMGDPASFMWARAGERSRAVTEQVRALHDAGLCRVEPHPSLFVPRDVMLTDAGREILAAHPEKDEAR